MKRALRLVLIIMGCLVGPIGVFIAIFDLGDGAYSGASNVKSISSYYILDYFTISATYNLSIIIAFAFLGWIIKSRKASLSKILNFTLLAHLFFIPSFLISLFLTVIPFEGNLKGFFIFPIFILLTAGGFIGFLLTYIIALVKLKKEKDYQLDWRSLGSYGVTILILLLLQIGINNEGYTITEIVSFEHETFSWGITRKSRSKNGIQNKKRTDPYSVYIKHKNDTDTTRLTLRDSYHSLYSEMKRVIPIQREVIRFKSYNRGINNGYRGHIEIILSKNKEKIYRVKSIRNPQTIYINPTKTSNKIADIITNDLKEKRFVTNILDKVDQDLIIESVSIGKAPSEEEALFFGPNENEKITVNTYGLVTLKKGAGKYDPKTELGNIHEGIYYSYPQALNMESYLNNTIKPIQYDKFKNIQNETLETLYPHINGTECASNINYALEKCIKTENLYLANKNINKGISSNINKLTKLSNLNTNGIDIGEIPSSICGLESLNTINFKNSLSLRFPKCFSKMNSLYFIEVNNSNLKQIPEAFLSLKNLSDLNLKGNRITKLPKELAELNSLDRITIDFNEKLVIAKEIIAKENLRLFFVSYNKEQTIKAEKFIEKYKRSYDQVKDSDIGWWYVEQNYEEESEDKNRINLN